MLLSDEQLKARRNMEMLEIENAIKIMEEFKK
jgi:hypothetical protein